MISDVSSNVSGARTMSLVATGSDVVPNGGFLSPSSNLALFSNLAITGVGGAFSRFEWVGWSVWVDIDV